MVFRPGLFSLVVATKYSSHPIFKFTYMNLLMVNDDSFIPNLPKTYSSVIFEANSVERLDEYLHPNVKNLRIFRKVEPSEEMIEVVRKSNVINLDICYYLEEP